MEQYYEKQAVLTDMSNTHKNTGVAVSICLPAYNGEKYIRQAIDSALMQTFTDFELIISDDGSTDNTWGICSAYEKNDYRIRCIRHIKNRNAYWNCNYVLGEARGTYVTFLAQDDALEKDFLEKTLAFMSNHPECILVTGDFESIDEHGQIIRIEELNKIRENIAWEKRLVEFFKYPQSKVCLSTYGLFKNKTASPILESIKYDRDISKGTEMLQLSRLAVRGQIASIPYLLRKQRIHSLSWYNSELKALNSKPFLSRKLTSLKNLYKIRLDQLKVLWSSSFPFYRKFDVTISIYGEYLNEFMARLLRVPGKILRLTKLKSFN